PFCRCGLLIKSSYHLAVLHQSPLLLQGTRTLKAFTRNQKNERAMVRATIPRLLKALLAAVPMLITAVVLAFAQTSPTASDATGIIPFLNQTIVWSRQLSTQQQLVSEPSDALF